MQLKEQEDPLAIKDLIGLEKPLTKLVETISDWALEPSRIVRRAKAEAKATVIKMGGDIAAAELAARAGYRVEGRELRRQVNIEAIATEAARQLPESVSSEPVARDWMSEFINCSQDVSDEGMQSLWARILAGEVAEPKSFSRRTLVTVRVMSKDEAESFTRLCCFVWRIDGDPVPIEQSYLYGVFRSGGVTQRSLTFLEVAGLILDTEGDLLVLDPRKPPKKPYTFEYFGTRFKARVSTLGRGGALRGLTLTPAGKELVRIAGGVRNDKYFDECLTLFRAAGLELEGAP